MKKRKLNFNHIIRRHLIKKYSLFKCEDMCIFLIFGILALWGFCYAVWVFVEKI